MATVVDRVLNPTIGLPWQLVMRVLRAIKDDDISLLDEEGLMDPALLPMAGMAFTQENMASGADLTDNPWLAFGLDVGLDPLTYASAGLTTAGKAARLTNALSRTRSMRKVAGAGGVSRETSVQDFLATARRAGEEGLAQSAKEQKLLGRAGELEDFGDMTVGDLLKHGSERELAIGIPGLARFGLQRKVNSDHQSWFQMMAAGNRAFYNGLVVAPLRHVPGVGSVVDRLATSYGAMRQGMRTPTRPEEFLRMPSLDMDPGEAADLLTVTRTGGLRDDTLDGMAGKVRRSLERVVSGEGATMDDRFGRAMRETGDPQVALLRAVGRRAPSDPVARENEALRVLATLTGREGASVPQSADEVAALAEDFIGRFDHAQARLQGIETGTGVVRPPLAGEKGERFFEIGQTVRKGLRKVFVQDLGVEDLHKWESEKRAAEAAADEKVQSDARELFFLRSEAAREMFPKANNPEVLFDRFLRNTFEASAAPEEVTAMVRGITDPEQAVSGAEAMQRLLSRATANTEVLAKMLRSLGVEGAESMDMRALVKQMRDNETGELSVMAERAVERLVRDGGVPEEMLAGPAVNMTRLHVTDDAGDLVSNTHLGFLSDGELRQELNRINKRARVPVTGRRQQEAIDQIQPLSDLQRRMGVDASKFGRILESASRGRRPRGFESFSDELRTASRLLDPETMQIVSGRGSIVDPAELSSVDRQIARAIPQLLDLRRQGATKQFDRVMQAAEPPVPFRDVGRDVLRKGEKVPIDETAAGLSHVQRAFVRMVAVSAELEDWGLRHIDEADKFVVSGTMAENVETALVEWNAALDEIVGQGMSPKAQKFFGALKDQQRQHMQMALETGLIGGAGFPLGYLPRVISGNAQDALRKMGVEMPESVRSVIAPQVGTQFARGLDHLSLDEVNDVWRTLMEQGDKERAGRIKEILEKEGLRVGFFEEDPTAAFVSAMGAMHGRGTTADFVNNAILEHGDRTMMLGGKVLGYVDYQNQTRLFPRQGSAAAELEGAEIRVGAGPDTVKEVPYRGVVLETTDGKVVTVPASQINSSFSFFDAGKVGTTVGDAFAHTLASKRNRTALKQAPSLDSLKEMTGNWVVYGHERNLGAMMESQRLTQKIGGDALRAFDSVNYFMRTFQTVMRPAFHVANLVSGVFQQQMLGTSLRHTVASHYDAARFLFDGDDAFVKMAERMSAHAGEARVRSGRIAGVPGTRRFRVGLNIIDAVRRIGRKGRPLTREELAELDLEHIADKVFELGDGSEIHGTELLFAAAQGELLGTFAARGFGEAGSITSSVKHARRTAERVAGGGRMRSALESARGTAEISEAYSRFAALFGRMREGVSMDTAVREVKKAFVDYNDITRIERNFLKRGITYYSFGRHYLPFALKQLARNPRPVPVMAGALRNTGVVSTTSGQMELKVGDARLSLQRMNANLDAMMALPALAERFTGFGRGPEDLRPPLQDPSFLAPGGIAQVVLGTDSVLPVGSRRPRKHWLEESLYTTFVTRWMYQGATGRGDGFLDELTRFMLPAKFVEEGFEESMLMSHHRELLNIIRAEHGRARSPWRRRVLEAEARQLTSDLQDALEREQR